MNLHEYFLWEKTKKWLVVLLPLMLVFLFINPLISLALLFVIFARLIYVEWIKSAFEKSAAKSQEDLEEKFDKMAINIKSQISTWEVDEILKLTKDFPDVYIDFIDEKNEYVVTWRNETAHFKNVLEMREWLTSFQ